MVYYLWYRTLKEMSKSVTSWYNFGQKAAIARRDVPETVAVREMVKPVVLGVHVLVAVVMHPVILV